MKVGGGRFLYKIDLILVSKRLSGYLFLCGGNKTNRESLVDLKPLYSHIEEDMRKKADESKSLRDKIWSLINASIYHKRKNESKKTTKKKQEFTFHLYKIIQLTLYE